WLHPLYALARQDFARLCDDLDLSAGKLRRTGLAPFLVGGDRSRRLRALDQILDLNFAARLCVRTLDDHAWRVAAVGIFELVAHVLGVAEIELGADIRVAQLRDHLLIIGDTITIEHCDDHRPEIGARVELAKHRQRRLQARHTDRKSRRRHRLAAEARDEAIVTAAAADRAEADGAA